MHIYLKFRSRGVLGRVGIELWIYIYICVCEVPFMWVFEKGGALWCCKDLVLFYVCYYMVPLCHVISM